ncbi:S-adenosylmethionine:tRNA ribosyltransferase-isomerase [mine drainage metagenome]|uniref:S-adenosylmethionine:tRNA ribosyltransferase-isomerase n=1 Tax=mine drainage metagenome TaxID=410659 RepID=A0A1J5TYC8_9ZZZZ
MPLSTDLFDYDLPSHLIAQTPADRRDQSRLLVVDRKARRLEHRRFSDLPDYLTSDDILVRNTASVLPARLKARRPTGGEVECFLLRPEPGHPGQCWWCLTRPARRLGVGAIFNHESGAFDGTIVEKRDEGTSLIRFETRHPGGIVAVANQLGEIPLPPYIERSGRAEERSRDIERYQTVYANAAKQVAVAAPTAGLHFTPELIDRLRDRGLRFADLVLHVGLGTFRPIATDHIEDHPIHREIYEVPAPAQALLFNPGIGRRVAVGTTSVRTIEDFLRKHRVPTGADHADEASIYLYPPANFLGTDALITNFHQPRSTLLCLVSAFLTPGSNEGIGWLKEIYREAIAREYRFFSYGDAMLIL